MRRIFFILALILAIATIASFFIFSSSPSPSSSAINLWPNNTDGLKNRLQSIGLPALTAEGDVLHTHQHLSIVINNKSVLVPASIGVPADSSFISPIHTHDSTGIIHVESPVIGTFTLGQFFQIWNIKLTPTCIDGYCQDQSHIFRVYSNGQPVADPVSLALTSHQEIFIFYGNLTDLPKTIPSSYQFPPDY